MRVLTLTLLLGMLAFAGCLDSDGGDAMDPEADDDGDGYTNQQETDSGTDPKDPESKPAETMEPADELLDMGEYTLNVATGQCDAKEYDETAPGVYSSGLGGGTWTMSETNDIPGLQLEDNHPGAGSGAGLFDLPVDARCINGDQVVA